MTPDQEEELLSTVKKVGWKMDTLVSDDLTKGSVPVLQSIVGKHSDQINFWRGAIAIVGFLLVVFGAILATHLVGGK
jgi:hypothetical protein